MKNLKRLALVAAVVGVLGAGGAVYASAAQTPADITAGLTGKSVEELQQERAGGKTYGAIAQDAGKLEEFKQQMLEQRKTLLEQRVKDGKITQERADQIIKAMEENQANCDGMGTAGMGMRNGAGKGMGFGNAQGQGQGQGNGQGQGGGAGRGMGGGFGGGMGACVNR